MDNMDYSAFAGFGIIALVVYLLVSVGFIALSVWISYTIMWRAVRRGLREFYQPNGQNPPVN